MRSPVCVVAFAACLLGALPTTTAHAGEDPLIGRSLVFTRAGKLYKADARGRGETELATITGKRTVRVLRTDSLGKVLLADVGGTWAWMPLDGSAKTLTDLPCEAGPAQLSVDGTYVLCRAKTGSLVVNLKSGKQTPLDVPTTGTRLVGSGSELRLVWADAQGVWNAVPPQRKIVKKVAPEAPLRAFSPSPDGTRALGVYADEVFESKTQKKPADVLMMFALDGTAARRKAIQSAIPVEWSHDSKWVLVQDPRSACIMLAIGGQYKCWRGYTAQSITSDGKYALVLGNRDRGSKSDKKDKKKKKKAKAEKKQRDADEETSEVSDEPEQEGDEHGDEPVAEDEVAVPPPSGPVALYRAELDGPYTKSPQLVTRDVDGAAVWLPGP
jgi:hypothetical protein